MALRRTLLAGLALTFFTGCASQTQQQSAPQASTELPTFRPPGSIKPADSSLAIASPAAETPVPAAPAVGVHPTGEWAPPVAPRAWKYIVLHHSASPSGNAALFDQEHRAKGWDELGYHFVIDNGHGGPDGRIEIGPRWVKQKWGAHAKTPDNRFNDFGIGICFVGNFEVSRPTPKQLASAERLIAWLESTYHIQTINIMGHEDTGKQTLCPGRNLNVAMVKAAASRELADGFLSPDMKPILTDATPADAEMALAPASVELLQSR